MTTKKQNKLLEKLKTVSKKKLVAIVSALLLLCVAGGFIIINKNTSVPVETVDSNPVVEVETLPEDYFEPSVELYNGYNEVLPYIAGEKFVITDYVNVKAYNNEFNIYFETINDGGVSKAYQDEGLHKIKIHVIDKFKHEAILVTHLLTEKKEVIEKLCAEDYKPTVSDYENLQKKMAEEQAQAQKKAEEDAKKIEGTSYSAGYDPNSSIVQMAQRYVETKRGICSDIEIEFIMELYGLSEYDTRCEKPISKAEAVPGDIIAYSGNHIAVYLGGDMALHGGIGGLNVKIMSYNLSNTGTPYFYRYDVGNPIYNGSYCDITGDACPTTVAKTADGAKEPEPSSNMTHEEWVESLAPDIKALRDACDLAFQNGGDENSPECVEYFGWFDSRF